MSVGKLSRIFFIWEKFQTLFQGDEKKNQTRGENSKEISRERMERDTKILPPSRKFLEISFDIDTVAVFLSNLREKVLFKMINYNFFIIFEFSRKYQLHIWKEPQQISFKEVTIHNFFLSWEEF